MSLRMHVRFEARGVESELELQPGTWTVGGGDDDGIRFGGLPPRLLDLELEPDRVWVRCPRPVLVGRAVLDSGVRRWLLPGERIRLSGEAQLWVEPPPEVPGTLALVRSLLEPGSTPVSSAAAALVCVAGVDAGALFLLAGPSVEIGRSRACAVRLGDGAVSRRHLELVADRDTHRVRDLGGRNGARCNGRWLRSGRLLADGDLLTVGRSLLHYRKGLPGPAATAISASAPDPPAPPAAPEDGGGERRSS